MATTKNGGPACPKLDRLEELIDRLTSYKEILPGEEEFVQECVEALDWLHTSLSNRQVYQKKQQIKKKVYLRLAKEILSAEELKQVDKNVETELATAVSNASE